jgi:hypothetical protein
MPLTDGASSSMHAKLRHVNRTQKVAFAVSGLVVASLVALAVPAVVAGAGALSSWVMIQPAAASTAAAAAADEADTAAEPERRSVSPADLPEGYVYMGDGTSIPTGGPGDCEASALISISGPSESTMTAKLLKPENLMDTGPREFAQGEVGRDAEGRIATYTVAPGDAPYAIGDRFCIYNGGSLPSMNGNDPGTAFSPGRTIVLDPAAVPGFVWDNPFS